MQSNCLVRHDECSPAATLQKEDETPPQSTRTDRLTPATLLDLIFFRLIIRDLNNFEFDILLVTKREVLIGKYI